MITIKYARIGDARFLSHLDMQTIIIRATKRAGYSAKYSQGFNPHTILKMSNPIPLGVESRSEYYSIEIDNASVQDYHENIKKMFPTNIIVMNSWETEKNPNISGITYASKYIIRNIPLEILQLLLLDKDKFNISISSRTLGILEIISSNGELEVVLPSGNINYRVDRFMSSLNSIYGLSLSLSDIEKKELFVVASGKIIEADAYLNELCNNYGASHKV